jgi:hypothetical protein
MKKMVAFKAKTSNADDNDDKSDTSTDDDVALMVKIQEVHEEERV